MRPLAGINFHPSKTRWLWGLGLLVLIGGCAFSYTLIGNYGSRIPRTVALLPVLNDTNDLDAPKEMRPLIRGALIERGYRVKPLVEVDALLKSRGIEEAGQIYTMTFRELGNLLGVDALLVSTVLDWSTIYLVAYSSITVEAEFRLIDAKTECVLWESRDKVSKRQIATDQKSLIKTLEAAVKISYSSLAKKVISRCFATLPYGVISSPPRPGKTRYRKIILRPGIP